jgi:tetratricopeptide (TPR) repeat protein
LRGLAARLGAALQWPLSPRGLGVLFFLLAAVIVRSGWLRPALSADLSALHLPLCFGDGPADLPEAILYGSHRPLALSLGAALLVLISLGIAAVLWRPRNVGWAAGLLLCGAAIACGLTVYNYPALIELLDLENEQRQLMIAVLPSRTEGPPLAAKWDDRNRSATPANGAVSAAPARDQEQGGLSRGWNYLQYGPYLVYLAILGVLLGTRGPLGRRLTWLAAWSAAAVVLAVLACNQRLRAEYHWDQARSLEAKADYPGARASLDQAVVLFPEFRRMQRTWLLAGKLDFRAGRHTPQETFFRAFQYRLKGNWTEALALMSEVRRAAEGEPAVRFQGVQVNAAAGLRYFGQGRLEAAVDLWQQATLLVPEIIDSRLMLAVAQARLDPHHPGRVEQSLGPLLTRSVADQPLRADSLVVLGNALFEAGRIREARRRYAESMDLFSLPRIVNFGAAKGLGGL